MVTKELDLGGQPLFSPQSYHLATHDFPLICPLQSALFIPELKEDCKHYRVQRTASLMACVINDSDPEAVENKPVTATEQEQKKKREEEREKCGRDKKLKISDYRLRRRP